jgi:hypothetical protein
VGEAGEEGEEEECGREEWDRVWREQWGEWTGESYCECEWREKEEYERSMNRSLSNQTSYLVLNHVLRCLHLHLVSYLFHNNKQIALSFKSRLSPSPPPISCSARLCSIATPAMASSTADSGSFPLADSTDLYALLALTSPSTPSAIKAAYRRAALLCHPDRLPPTASPADIEAANAQFQKVGFAYAVLKDDVRRERYDRDGTTEEGGVGRSEQEWKDYFKELWKGEVNGLTLDQFKAEYQGMVCFSSHDAEKWD